MTDQKSALLLIGFQNDFFSEEGVLHEVLENPETVANVLENTLTLINKADEAGITVIETPIIFTKGYTELIEPVGILKMIRDLRAFQEGSPGAETLVELQKLGSLIKRVPGKRGLNAFTDTELQEFLRGRGITEVALSGVVTSLCIDSTGRAAHERGYRVTILSDCTCGRSKYEQDFYCKEVFPLYASVTDATSWLGTRR